MDPAQDPHSGDAAVAALLAKARERDRAPAALRERVQRERQRARHRPAAWRVAPGLAALATVLAVAVVLVLSGGSAGSPTIAQAAALATRGPALPAPAASHERSARLQASVGEVYFPDWRSSLGWKAVGERRDRLAGRDALTVYYARNGEQVAYTIVATPPLAEPSARVLVANRLIVRALTINGRNLVTWRRGGATCILSGTGVDHATLANLASWSD